MAKQFFTNGTGSQQTLTPSQNEKVAIYDTVADAEADLANLEEGQIVATPDTGDELAQPVDTVASGNMHAITSNAVYASELAIRKGSQIVSRCSKVAGDYAQHWAKLFSFGIGRQYDSGVCFFEIVGHSIDKGSKVSGYIGGYTQSISNPYIWNSSDTLNNASLYYNKEVQSDGNVLINVYVPTFTDNYMWWELNLSSSKDLIVYNSPDLITDVSGLIAFTS